MLQGDGGEFATRNIYVNLVQNTAASERDAAALVHSIPVTQYLLACPTNYLFSKVHSFFLCIFRCQCAENSCFLFESRNNSFIIIFDYSASFQIRLDNLNSVYAVIQYQ